MRICSLLALLTALAAPLLASADSGLQRFAFEKAEMGVPFRITLYARDAPEAEAGAEAAFARVEVLNSILTDYDSDSELSRLSRTSGQGKAVPVSGDLWQILKRSQELAERTGGAFDITAGPAVNLWRRARRTRHLPSAELLEEMRNRVGFMNLRLNEKEQSAELLRPDMRLDAGGIAKGYAADQALAVLRQRGLPRALVAASGDMAAGEPPPDQPGWRVEVSALDVPGAPPPQILLLRDCGISTSGDASQRVEIGGVRYSHIVDPRTGVGLTDHSLVTVVARDATTADALATAASVLGPVRGLEVVEATPGAAAHHVRQPGEALEVHESKGWRDVPKVPPKR